MKNLTLVRGVSGSGKTTFARMLSRSTDICLSTDDFWSNNGRYDFDASRLGDAHRWCQHRVEHYMSREFDVVVHNTFTQEWEMEPYFKLAEKYGYRVFTVIVENRHGGKNVHDVPDETLEKQKKRFSVKL